MDCWMERLQLGGGFHLLWEVCILLGGFRKVNDSWEVTLAKPMEDIK
jgi:hypothetical protein